MLISSNVIPMVRVTKTCQAIVSIAYLDATASQGVNLDCLSLTK